MRINQSFSGYIKKNQNIKHKFFKEINVIKLTISYYLINLSRDKTLTNYKFK